MQPVTDDGGWIVSIQHWAGHRLFTNDKPPPVRSDWVATRELAEARKAELRLLYPDRNNTLICASPAGSPKKKKKRGRR
jgi:hypothetical protein